MVLRNEGIEGIILIRTEPKKAKELYEFFTRKFDEIFEFSGRFDLAIKVNCKSLDELNRIVDDLSMSIMAQSFSSTVSKSLAG